MKAIEYLVHLLVYECFVLICAMTPLPIILLIPPSLVKGPLEVGLNLVKGVLALGALFGGSWLAHNAALKRVFEGEGFFQAFSSAVADARLYLSYLPWVGPLFRGRQPASSPFDDVDDGDENRFR